MTDRDKTQTGRKPIEGEKTRIEPLTPLIPEERFDQLAYIVWLRLVFEKMGMDK
jgi:hypothetical protein